MSQPLLAPRTQQSSSAAWMRALAMTAPIGRNPHVTLPTLVQDLAATFGTAPALLSDEECLSYRALAQRANQYARWALARHLVAGDIVCVMLPNCPDYLAIWLGLTRVGVTAALINTNLVGASLAHVVNVVHPGYVIVGSDFADTLMAARPLLARKIQCWVHGADRHDLPRIDDAARHLPGDRLDDNLYPPPAITDRALCIYTSGTTGLPKAANVSHFRLMQWSHWFAGMMDTGAGDRIYNCLPMYHSVGGVVAIGAALVGGGSVVLRPRFSAQQFWHDIVRWDCTVFQYIGELCRYLVNSPPHKLERQHRLRLSFGNGLGPDVWDRFKRRFAIPQILEFYAATEANFSLCNREGEPGAIGRMPPFLAHRVPVALIRLDPDTGTAVRGADTFCIRCSADEAGEAISQIAATLPGSQFEGYTDTAASERKILRDVFATGDRWFRTGDLMRRDRRGFFYFVGRIGDTFRWKGENVSAAEVAEKLRLCRGVSEAVVYGVAVPGADGRAGMATIVVATEFDLATLRRHLSEQLPSYARPLFLRICERIDATATFKPQTHALMREGFDPASIGDAVYVDDRSSGAYVRLDPALHARIVAGTMLL
jgi:fatty-acyl-CoA synthase